MDRLFYLADLFGVAVFAITGALMAGRKSMDLFGVLVIAIVTALGGGTLRDLILDNHPVSWIRNDTYIWVASLAGVGTVLWVRMTQPIHERGLLIADAFGLAVVERLCRRQGRPAPAGILLDYGTSVSEASLDPEGLEGLGPTAPNNLRHFVGYAAVGYY